MKTKLTKILLAGLSLSLFLVLFISCHEDTPTNPEPIKPKYIFLFIGDGMGSNHVSLTEALLAGSNGQIGMTNLTMTDFPFFGLCTTYSNNSNITDSGAAGSAIACGEKADNGVISYYPSLTDTLEPVSIAKIAHNHDFKVGIITTVGINHATPAVFYASNESRSNYYQIGLEVPESGFEFFGGGGFISPTDDETQTDLYTITEESSYTLTSDLNNLSSLNSDNSKVFFTNPVLLWSAEMPYAIDRDNQGGYSLDEIVESGIDFLDNPTGFFIMVEGGKIDWAAHKNDAATIVRDMQDFDNAIFKAYEFYLEHPYETLIIVTSDHETGGLSLGNNEGSYYGSYASIALQACSQSYFASKVEEYKNSSGNYQFSEVMQLTQDYFFTENIELTETEYNKALDAFNYYFYGATSMSEEQLSEVYGGYNPVAAAFTDIINTRSSVSFTTWSHTGTRVPVYTIGAGSEFFSGGLDNTDFHRIICEIMNW